MQQRVPRTWSVPKTLGRKPRLLVESGDPALTLSDFGLFKEAGFLVAHCPGPAGSAEECPLACGADCPLVANADVVLHQLRGARSIFDEIRARHPEVPVVAMGCRGVESHVGTAGVVEVLSDTAPVASQIRALYRALFLAKVLSIPAGSSSRT